MRWFTLCVQQKMWDMVSLAKGSERGFVELPVQLLGYSTAVFETAHNRQAARFAGRYDLMRLYQYPQWPGHNQGQPSRGILYLYFKS